MDHYKDIELVLMKYTLLMSQAKKAILADGVSNYPIFVLHRQVLELGVPLVDAAEEGGDQWSLHVATLEEFVQRQIIEIERVDDFREVYRNATDQHCVFVIAEVGAKFLFIPA